MTKYFSYFAISLFQLALLINPSAVHAITIKLDRLQVFETVKPNTIAEGVINVINDTDEPIKVATSIGDFDYDDNFQKALHEPFGTRPDSCSRWIRLGFDFQEIPPHTTQALQYVITVPILENLQLAEYYSLIYVETISSAPDLTTDLALGSRARLSVVVKMKIEDLALPAGEVDSVEIIPGQQMDPLLIKYTFSNKGNTLHRISGSFVIMDYSGNLFGRGTLNHGYAKPGNSMSIETPWEGDLPDGEYDIITEFRYEPDIIDIHETSLQISS